MKFTHVTIKSGEPGYWEPAYPYHFYTSGAASVESDEAKECGSTYRGFICTREINHDDGPHAAHGPNDVQYATWSED